MFDRITTVTTLAVGIGSLAYGLDAVYPPLAPIVIGIILIYLAFEMASAYSRLDQIKRIENIKNKAIQDKEE